MPKAEVGRLAISWGLARMKAMPALEAIVLAKFDAIREEILSGIADGTIDSETASNLNILRRLAESIVIK